VTDKDRAKAGPLPESPTPVRPRPLLGAHVSTAGGLDKTVPRALEREAEALQVFPSNSRRWKPYGYTPADLLAFGDELARARLPLYVHSIYLINLAADDDEIRRSSSAALAYALYFGALAGASGVVTHVGSHKGAGFEAGLARVGRAVAEAHELVLRSLERAALSATGSSGQEARAAGELRKLSLPPLLLETSAGSKNTMGRDIDEMAALLDRVSPLEAGVCLDTAHLYASGVPVHTPEGLEELTARVADSFGWHRVALIHLNDCRTRFGSQHDQHANLGEGELGETALRAVVQHPRMSRVPFILEVPGIDGHGPDLENVRRAQRLRSGEPLLAG
jgi:deoxyribonuclease IV